MMSVVKLGRSHVAHVTKACRRLQSCYPRVMAGVQSIERAFTVLRELSLGPAGVTEIAEQVGLAEINRVSLALGA